MKAKHNRKANRTQKTRKRSSAKTLVGVPESRDTAPPKRGRTLREKLDVNQSLFARLVGTTSRSVASWEAGKPVSPSSKRQLRETCRLLEALMAVMAPGTIRAWLETPNEAFDGLKPVEVVERGQSDRLWRMIYMVQSGMPA